MGLSTTHGCWDGPYSAFMRWRKALAQAAGLPPLELMDGFCREAPFTKWYPNFLGNPLADIETRLPIKWECLKPDPLIELLDHSDCDGSLPWRSCKAIADRLDALIPSLSDYDASLAERFSNGLREAFEAKEDVEFH